MSGPVDAPIYGHLLAKAGLQVFPKGLPQHQWRLSPDRFEQLLAHVARLHGVAVARQVSEDTARLFGYPVVVDPELPRGGVLLELRGQAMPAHQLAEAT